MIICVRILCKCLGQTWEKFHYHNRHTLSSAKHTDSKLLLCEWQIGMRDCLGFSAVEGPWGDPFGWSSAKTLCNLFLRAHVTSSTAPWPGKPALTRPVIIQINYQSVDCLNLLEQCRSDMRQQFVSFHVQRFFHKLYICSKTCLLSDNL